MRNSYLAQANTKLPFRRELKNRLSVVLLLCSIVSASNALAQYTDIKRLGTSQAICEKPGVQTREELQKFFTDNPKVINRILEDAKWQGDPNKLFDAIAAGNFTEKQYRPGTKFEWMGMRTNGKLVSKSLRRWVGKDPFDGFEANVVEGCNSYQFVIPKICCNLAVTDITVVVDEPRLEVFVDGSSIRVCTDQNASVTLSDPNGYSSGLSLDQDECWQGVDVEPGDYTITAVGECGRSVRTATIAGATKKTEPQKQDKSSAPLEIIPFVAAFVGTETVMRLETAWDMEVRDSSGIVGARGGLKIPLNKTLTVVTSLGVLNRNGVNGGNEYPDDSVNVDLGIEKYINDRIFLGAGIGAWNASDGDFREGTIFVNVGGTLTESTEWFAEARGIDSDNPDGNDGFSDNRSFSAGFRFLFK